MTDFAPFGAPANSSVFGTKVAATPFSLAGGKAAFGTPRNDKGLVPDDDDDEEAGRQKVELREDSISLDQVYIPILQHHCHLIIFFSRPAVLRCRVLGGAPRHDLV